MCTHQFVPRLDGACDGYILMEAVRGCELFYLLREVHRFEPATATFYLAMVVSALVHLHGLGIVHRDLKPENLVLDGEGYLSLIDYGHARLLESPSERAWTLAGTPEYTAPEVLRGIGHGKEVDTWAVGVLLFELLAGYPAFCADEPIKVYSLVLNAAPSVPRSFPTEAKELIGLLLRPQPHSRLGALRGGIVDVACGGRHQLQAREGGEGGFGGGAAAIITAAGKITAEQQGDILMIAEQYVGMGDQAAQYVLRVAVPSGPQLGAIIAVERDWHAQIGRRLRRRQC